MKALDRPLISVHFPKASGTSFRVALEAAFGPPAVLGSYDCDPLDPANPMWIDPNWFCDNHKDVCIQRASESSDQMRRACFDYFPRGLNSFVANHPPNADVREIFIGIIGRESLDLPAMPRPDCSNSSA
jgi:hypothetical protein